MKLIFNTKELIEKIKNVAPTAEAKQTLAILGNLKVTIKGNVAEFVASDLEIQVTSNVPCNSDEDGSFTVPAKKLLEICNALSAHDEITLLYDGKKIDITAGKSKVSLQTLDSKDYPDMTSGESTAVLNIDQKDLIKLISKTLG